MSDPIRDLANFNSPGLAVEPLPPSEVRRLGDRLRRRRNAAAAVAGVAAVAVVAGPLALLSSGDGRVGPGPGPGVSTPVSPDVFLPSPTDPNRIDIEAAEISFRFPLPLGWPRDSEAEREELGLEGPSRNLDILVFAGCNTTFDDPAYVDRLRADWTDVEDYRSRQLTTYADTARATAAVKALTDFFRSCPTEDFDDGYSRLGQVVRTEVGHESWALVRHFERGGAPAVGLEIIHVIRVGRAVLIDTAANEGGAGPDREGEVQRHLDAMSASVASPVESMCAFTQVGCGEGQPPPRRNRRP